MFDSRRYLGTFAVVSLVLLRLVVGWHFYREGTQKLEYDRRTGEFRMRFSSEGFLSQAKGPLASWYRAYVPDDHGWQALLATPLENRPATAEETAEQAKWGAEHKLRREEAAKNGVALPFEFPPSAVYHAWAARIAEDWRTTLDNVKRTAKLTDEQKQQADAAIEARLQQLSDYLSSKSEDIAEYRHQLWRLDNWRNSPEAGSVPFVEERISAKAAEISGMPSGWVREVRTIEAAYHKDLRKIITDEQRQDSHAAIENVLKDPREHKLDIINRVVIVLTIAVGVCLLLGLFTRVASIAGAAFLFGVIASQPPWVYDAAPTMPNIIEFAALLVLAGAAAGRWMGLDLFIYAWFNRRETVRK